MTDAEAGLTAKHRRFAGSRGSGVLYFIAFLGALGYAAVVPLIPFLVLHSGGNALLGGAVVAVHALMSVCSAPWLGRLSDRIGRRTVLALTLTGLVFAYLLLAYANSLILIFAARILAGVMAGNVGVIQAALVDSASPERRGGVMSRIMAAWALGYIAGPAFSAGISMLAPTKDVEIVGFSSAAISLLALCVLWLDPPPEHSIEAPPSKEGRSAETGGVGAPQMQVLLVLGAASLCVSGLTAITGFWANAVYGWAERGVSLLLLWVAVAVSGFQGIIMPLMFRKFSPAVLLMGCYLFCGIACVSLWLWGHVAVLMGVSVTVLFVGLTAGQSVATTLLSLSAKPADRGRIMGLGVSAGGLGRVAGPVAFGALFAHMGANSPFATVLTVMVVCALCSVGFASPSGSAR